MTLAAPAGSRHTPRVLVSLEYPAAPCPETRDPGLSPSARPAGGKCTGRDYSPHGAKPIHPIKLVAPDAYLLFSPRLKGRLLLYSSGPLPSQEIFAFEWNDPENGLVGQFTWTRLPQKFKNSPTIFNEALSKDLVFPLLPPINCAAPVRR